MLLIYELSKIYNVSTALAILKAYSKTTNNYPNIILNMELLLMLGAMNSNHSPQIKAKFLHPIPKSSF